MSLLFHKRTLKRQEKADDYNSKCERSLTNKITIAQKIVKFESVRAHSHRTRAKKTKDKPTHIKHNFCFGSVWMDPEMYVMAD